MLTDHPGLVGQVIALLGGLLLLLIALRARPRPASVRANVAQDFAHIAFRAAVLVPITALVLGALDHGITAFAPFLRVDVLGRLPMPSQFIAFVVLADLIDYGIHRLFHAVPWLWQFHAVHHSQTWVNPLTTTRAHPLEILVKRVLTWAPLVILGGPDQPWLLWVALDGFWGFFVHSGLRVPLGPLKYVIVSPEFHAVHHSQALAHRDTNLGERLAIWDVVFGTARFDVVEVPQTGVDDPSFPIERDAHPQGVVRTWLAQFVYPFRQLFRRPSPGQ
jgi:sterol desaturase/sphingolipid hydroxylase (fatty acid hydroxylase superfamily)